MTPADQQLIEMNDTWSVLDEGGELSVVRFVPDDALGRERLVRYSFADLHRKFGATLHHESGKPLGEAWLSWPGRKQYDRLCFKPGEFTPPDVLNLWRGFAVEPRPGVYDRIEEHLVDVACGGDLDLYDYLFHWLARAVQFPGKQGEVAVVLRGKEGVGKSLVGVLMRRIFGQHALAVSSPAHVVGNFNSHLADVVFLDAAEALFAGDRQTASKLKALITDGTFMLERKGADAVPWVNRLTVLMTSNEEWVVPAGPESRRYFVLDVSDKHRGDRDYFRALWNEVNDNAAVGAFLHELQSIDLTGWDHREVPATAALRDQRERSLTGVLAWALDLCSRGTVRTEAGTMPWRSFFTTRELYADYREWAAGQRFERALSVNVFGRELKSVLGLHWVRRALKGCSVPGVAEGQPGYEVPGTVAEFERLVRRAAGLAGEEADETEEGVAA